jgi:16S rRNA (cytosine967-C5)-methyltransferase
MTPAARLQAAIEILDEVLDGAPAERALTRWARSSRFAGSKDRAAVRDHVFDALRQRDSFAWLGGGLTGRGLILGAVRARSDDPSAVFSGQGYGPAPVNADEIAAFRDLHDAPDAVQLDLPDWMVPLFTDSLGPSWRDVAQMLRHRAPVDLRVNTLRCDALAATEALARDGIATQPVPGVSTALRVTEGARQVARSAAYLDGRVEIQDASSQAAVLACAPLNGVRVLDYCAGGGGKALALAALTGAPVHVHDIDPARMRDIPTRATRAGAACPQWDGNGAFELVFVDAPCSGSGSWRRSPDAKWRLTHDRLAELQALQAKVLSNASAHVMPGGRLAYATCSIFASENEAQVSAFLADRPGWTLNSQQRFDPRCGGDGFFIAILEC